MTEFRILETAQFRKNLTQDFSGQQARIQRKLAAQVYPQLRINPYYGKHIKKLRNYQPETWRYRIGDYRFFYRIDDTQHSVIMLTADAHGRAY